MRQVSLAGRLLREVALDATADPGETPVSAGDVAIAEDIARHEKASVGAIAARTGLAQSLVSRTAAKLHDAGLVVTERDPGDGRRILISIAPASARDFSAHGPGAPSSRPCALAIPTPPRRRSRASSHC
jgi:DNA-binding MarR family transcriptional regulator